MNGALKKYINTLEPTAKMCAQLCRAVQSDFLSSMSKNDNSPVTIADYGCQALIHRAIKQNFPEHSLISEEDSAHLKTTASTEEKQAIAKLVSTALKEEFSIDNICEWIDYRGPSNAEFTWSIDPIDGTKGFLRQAQYAIAIGLLQAKVPVAGILVCPNLPYDLQDPDSPVGIMLTGCGPKTATKKALDAESEELICSNSSFAPAEIRVLGSVESAHGDPKLVTGMINAAKISGGFVRYDSQAKYAVIAMGQGEIYLRPRSKPDYRENIWDHVAGVAVCESAGAIVTDIDGKDLDFSHGAKLVKNRGILATANEEVHKLALEGINYTESL